MLNFFLLPSMESIKEISSIKELHDYQILDYIGQGSFGKVYYALEKKTSHEVAIKVIFFFFLKLVLNSYKNRFRTLILQIMRHYFVNQLYSLN